MEDEKIISIYNKLVDLTKNKKIEWSPEKESSGYSIKINNLLIRFVMPTMGYLFQIKDKDGNVLGKIRDINVPIEQLQISMSDFYKLIKRQALKIDDNLDDLLNTLQKL